MIIALGEKVFGALLVITGAAIILTGHWATTDDMIADLIAGGLMLAFGNRGKTRGRQGGRGWVATNSGRYGMAGLPGTASLEPR